MAQVIRIIDGLREVQITLSKKLFNAALVEMNRVIHVISKNKPTKINPVFAGVKVEVVKEITLHPGKKLIKELKVAKKAGKEKR